MFVQPNSAFDPAECSWPLHARRSRLRCVVFHGSPTPPSVVEARGSLGLVAGAVRSGAHAARVSAAHSAFEAQHPRYRQGDRAAQPSALSVSFEPQHSRLSAIPVGACVDTGGSHRRSRYEECRPPTALQRARGARSPAFASISAPWHWLASPGLGFKGQAAWYTALALSLEVAASSHTRTASRVSGAQAGAIVSDATCGHALGLFVSCDPLVQPARLVSVLRDDTAATPRFLSMDLGRIRRHLPRVKYLAYW